MMLTLYQVEWCPSCHQVRQVMTELGLTYANVNVPLKPEDRAAVMAVSGQDRVPVLRDGDRVLIDSGAIVDHLRAAYPAAADAAAHAEVGSWRLGRRLSISPHAALSQVLRLLDERGFVVVAETSGPDVSDQLPREYVVLGVILPEAGAQAVAVDAGAPGAVLLSVAVAPTGGGGSLVTAADPVGQIWLFADAALRKTQAVAKRRLKEILAAL
jgi:glutaredoxin